MADLKCDPCLAGPLGEFAPTVQVVDERFFDENIDVAVDTGRDRVVMVWRRDRDGNNIDCFQ
nr:hypothetical protein [Halodesulfurarchaeum formicicum]